MSILATASTTRVTWANVSDGFSVASRAGDYVGCVESTPDGHFVGFDFRSTPVGRYATLAEAQRSVGAAHGKRPVLDAPPHSPRAEAMWQTAATLTGAVALGVLATAVLTTPIV
ncbi:peptide ABC transporter permease [Microbacterium sp. VKM Ac-2870]|uniref:peptide ABC transporter permease n=1 Tax=Microbacterium sp. VKM Ac-2870 TaxID=2783825 RepID=UPI00188B7737|nr:peptide ABC transporter permease [Microbacterium sp. VKM Ac-2870]MBF4562205.1 peptide ABC transporter permease [Microbacterium sp. VKM Ac-2870]